jgi:tripartite-type tricarboxylate transporter receptor subunit TctC
MAGETQVTFGTSPTVLPMATGGRLQVLAVSTRDPSPLTPDLPGMRDAGLPDYHIEFWYGMFAPAGTPQAVVTKIYEATVAAMKQPSVEAALARQGTEVSLSPSPENFAGFLQEDGKFWVHLVKSAKVKVD